MENFKYKRKPIVCGPEVRFLTDELQKKFVLKFCVVVVTGAVLSGALIYWQSRQTLTTVFDKGRLTVMSTADFILPSVLFSTFWTIIFIGLLLALVIGLSFRRMRHSLCQIKYEVEKAGAGALDDVHLNFRRKDDEFKVLALSLHGLIQDFKKFLAEIKTGTQSLQKDLLDEEARGVILPKKFKEDLAALNQKLSKFRP